MTVIQLTPPAREELIERAVRRYLCGRTCEHVLQATVAEVNPDLDPQTARPWLEELAEAMVLRDCRLGSLPHRPAAHARGECCQPTDGPNSPQARIQQALRVLAGTVPPPVRCVERHSS